MKRRFRSSHKSSQSQEYLRTPVPLKIKLLMIGDSGVGKSCLVQRFSRDEFPSDHIATIGIDYEVKTLDVDDQKVKLQLWDTAGMERFRTITYAYYRGAHGVILVYDVTDEQSFFSIRTWMNNIDVHAQKDVCKILVGNKVDVHEERRVSRQRAEELAKDYDVTLFETSAKTNDGVHEALMHVIRGIIQSRFTDHIAKGDTTVVVDVTTNNKVSGCMNCACQIL